jgi:hypothetical protein
MIVDKGLCRFCGKRFDITEKLLQEEKKYLEEAYPNEAPMSDKDALNLIEICEECC